VSHDAAFRLGMIPVCVWTLRVCRYYPELYCTLYKGVLHRLEGKATDASNIPLTSGPAEYMPTSIEPGLRFPSIYKHYHYISEERATHPMIPTEQHWGRMDPRIIHPTSSHPKRVLIIGRIAFVLMETDER